MTTAVAQGQPDPFANAPNPNPQNGAEVGQGGEQMQVGGGPAPNNDENNADAEGPEQGDDDDNAPNDMKEKDPNCESSFTR